MNNGATRCQLEKIVSQTSKMLVTITLQKRQSLSVCHSVTLAALPQSSCFNAVCIIANSFSHGQDDIANQPKHTYRAIFLYIFFLTFHALGLTDHKNCASYSDGCANFYAELSRSNLRGWTLFLLLILLFLLLFYLLIEVKMVSHSSDRPSATCAVASLVHGRGCMPALP